jgi:N-hydroxyarylamine O-acetyltransferase
MKDGFDIQAYLQRLGYRGNATPTLETLRALHELHPRAIPFENLSPLLRLPVQLDAASLQRKLITDRRGGYCYEHNLLLKHVLDSLGFRVTGLGARVVLNHPEDAVPARTHMLLAVDLADEVWIADVGFGGLTLTAPLRLVENVPQATPHEPFRITRRDGDFVLQSQVRDEWRSLYRFDLQEHYQPDYELVSWYLCHNPGSPFLTRLVAARSEQGRRYALRNNEFATHELNGQTVRRTLSSVADFRSVLTDAFRIALPNTPALDQLLETVAKHGAPHIGRPLV